MNSLMIWGASGQVGKTIITISLSRLLFNNGIRVCPYKGIAVTNEIRELPDGTIMDLNVFNIAEAASIPPPNLNPVLIVPKDPNVNCDLFSRDYEVDLYFWGKRYETTTISKILIDRINAIQNIVVEGYNSIRERYEYILIEGSGSPVEGGELSYITNIELAKISKSPCLLIVRSDNGAPISSAVGTIKLLKDFYPEFNQLSGVILNKGIGESLGEEKLYISKYFKDIPILGDAKFADPKSKEYSLMNEEIKKNPGDNRDKTDKWYDFLSSIVCSDLDLSNISNLLHLKKELKILTWVHK